MKLCPRCGALFIARFELNTPFGRRIGVIVPDLCHCSVDHDVEAPYSVGESLRDLTDEERDALREWLAGDVSGLVQRKA